MKEQIMELLLVLPIILIALPVREVARTWVADKLGDPTGKNFGKLSLNPLKHINPIGFICMMLFRFGWSNSVPINSRNFKKPRRDIALCALAGPVANLALAFLGVVLYKAAELIIIYTAPATTTANNIAQTTLLFFALFATINTNFAIFNLLPIPSLDGSRILYAFLPAKLVYKIERYEMYISLALIVLLAFPVSRSWLVFASQFVVGSMEFVINIILYGIFWLINLLPIF